jgi:steroid delta-isomerase-like uncharacterized protein
MGTERNKEVIRRYYEHVLDGGDVDALDELAVPDYDEHDPLPGQEPGLKDRVTAVRKGLAPHVTIDDVIAEDDKVVVRWTNSGTNLGEFLGIPATGRSFTIPGIDIHRLEGGRMAEHWHVVDMLGHLQQLGLLPSPEEVKA